ncbi:hypothetical protein C9374_010364 [Naegleria lovaniensis]|uniref:Uncharacterized protein n=1 Tax=Naegleria lovaniensis TaxID=51637 RepID=A0AA88KDU0_NAELO|nr:uncharacterized protein C9374_010364 [Naegleria lovaniensis]KAG2374990.1 hypothetical protein C9374_010364 [Naegleria lovaniensis]
MSKINIREIFNKDFITPIIQGRILAKKDPISLGTVNGNVLLSRFLFRDLEKRFGSVKALNDTLGTSEHTDEVFDEFSIASSSLNHGKREDIYTLTCLSRSEYEILITKFVKLQYLLHKEPNLLQQQQQQHAKVTLNDHSNESTTTESLKRLDEANGESQSFLDIKHDISNRIVEFIGQKIDEAFIDSMGEYYLLDENQIDRLWRFPLLEMLLVGSFSNFKVARSASSLIDELVPNLPFLLNFEKDINDETEHNASSSITTTAKKTIHEPIYVTPPFERENWGWQVEDFEVNKSKKD